MARTSDKTDLLQGTLDLLILQVVALGPVHGYAIAQRLNQMSREALQVPQGSLYPALHRLEERCWLRSRLTSTHSPPTKPRPQRGRTASATRPRRHVSTRARSSRRVDCGTT